ncbi:hypothetical protein ACLOJK_018582 [Asimina triloba]
MLIYLLPLLFFLASPSASLPPPLLTSLSKDPSTLQYTTTILHKTPLKPSKFVIDLGLSFSWVDCKRHYISSSYLPIPCNATLCSTIASGGCANATCSLFAHNSFRHLTAPAPAIADVLALPSTTGRGAGPAVKLPTFLLSCSPTFMLRGLARGSSGVVALGWSNHSLPAQVIATFSLPQVFALCLSGSPSAPGVAFFGTAGPYIFLPGAVDASKSLVYTPLIRTPPSNYDYYIAVTSIQINGRRLKTRGRKMTKLSTVEPYTKMETSIYKAFTKAFVRAAKAMNITPTKAVKPFRACFLYGSVGSTRAGPGVPTIDLVLHGDEDAVWRLRGENSMVLVNPDVLCLAFVDGGPKQRDAMVVGGHQLEDNLVQFDLGKKRVGFSSSLLLRQTTCANFNFSVAAL